MHLFSFEFSLNYLILTTFEKLLDKMFTPEIEVKSLYPILLHANRILANKNRKFFDKENFFSKKEHRVIVGFIVNITSCRIEENVTF